MRSSEARPGIRDAGDDPAGIFVMLALLAVLAAGMVWTGLVGAASLLM
jgi:hypothetical protein